MKNIFEGWLVPKGSRGGEMNNEREWRDEASGETQTVEQLEAAIKRSQDAIAALSTAPENERNQQTIAEHNKMIEELQNKLERAKVLAKAPDLTIQ